MQMNRRKKSDISVYLKALFCFLTGVILILFAFSAYATEVFDFRNSLSSYYRKVAEINLDVTTDDDAVFGAKSVTDGNDYIQEVILFKISNGELNLDTAPFKIYSVVYGPSGFSILISDETEAAVTWLSEQKGVDYAETDSMVEACGQGDMAGQVAFHSYGAERMGYAEYIKYVQGWGTESVEVAVIDSGVCRHSLITPKICRLGYDYVDNDVDPTNDLNGHGTRVAGIVADSTQQLPVNIYPIRVLDANANGKLSNVVNAVLEAVEADVDVINLSLSTFVESESLQDAIRRAVANGITVVAAAGNYACDAGELTPAKMMDPGVIVVGSVDADGSRSSFSNYGASVDIYTYGRSIESCSRSGGYVTDTGTSMAAPHISALSAMLKLLYPSISPIEIETRIKAAGMGVYRIPYAPAMIPQDYGFALTNVVLWENDRMSLPAEAMPALSQENITYVSSNPSIADVSDGILYAYAAGTTKITAHCKGLADTGFSVMVNHWTGGDIVLPSSLRIIEERAFEGLNAAHIEIPSGVSTIEDGAFQDAHIGYIVVPDTVEIIGENAFGEAIIICSQDSPAALYAREHQLQYINLG